MNNTPSTGLSHPLVAAYLTDLERALSSAGQQERIDTIAAVREHLTDALGGAGEPTTDEVRAVLDELGSVEQIAASATPASTPPTLPASTLPGERKEEGGWAAPTLLAVAIVSLMIPLFGGVLAIGCLITAVVLLRGGAPRRSFLQATVVVSIVSLVVTVVLVAGSLALFRFSGGTPSVSSGPVPSFANDAPSPSKG